MYFLIEKLFKVIFGIDRLSFSLEIFLYQEHRLKFNNFRKIVTSVFLQNKKSSNKYHFLLYTSIFCYIRHFHDVIFSIKKRLDLCLYFVTYVFFWIWSYEYAFSDRIPIILNKPLERTPLKTPKVGRNLGVNESKKKWKIKKLANWWIKWNDSDKIKWKMKHKNPQNLKRQWKNAKNWFFSIFSSVVLT